MTAQVHDHPAQAGPAARGSTRPRWLVPALVGGVVVGALVIFGVLSPSAVLYGGLIGGMLLMHAGGHGGHSGHAGGATSDTRDLSHGSHGSQPGRSGSDEAPRDDAPSNASRSETQNHDQHTSHGCH